MKKFVLCVAFCFLYAVAVNAMMPASEIRLERGVYACSKCGGSFITCTCKRK